MVRGAANRAWAALCSRGGPRSSNGGRGAPQTFSEDARRSPLRSGQAISLSKRFSCLTLAGLVVHFEKVRARPRSAFLASARRKLTLIGEDRVAESVRIGLVPAAPRARLIEGSLLRGRSNWQSEGNTSTRTAEYQCRHPRELIRVRRRPASRPRSLRSGV